MSIEFDDTNVLSGKIIPTVEVQELKSKSWEYLIWLPLIQQRIFETFQRFDHSNKYPGTGIGLTVARKAIQRMGGKIGLVSEPEHGSKFWIELKKETAC